MVEKNGKFTATTPLRSGFGQIDHGFPLVERVAVGLVRAAPLSADVGDHEIGLLDHVAIPVGDGKSGEVVAQNQNVSLNNLVVQCCEYALENIDNSEAPKDDKSE